MAQESTGKSSEIFRLDTGAYGIPKRGRPSRTSTSADKALREQMNLAVQVGEDSYFVRPDSLGVADGVGGFHRKPNSNSALFSLTLMHHCALELSQLSQQSSSTSPSSSPSSSSNPPASSYPSPPPSPSHTHTHTCASPDPVSILQRAHERTLDSFSRAGLSGGASTALLATLHSSHLHIAHLGDCSIHLIRQGTLVFRSTAQQHAFNCPLQLGPLSGSTPRRDAWSGVLEVKEGDVVVMASDGMGDNLWDEDVVDEVRRFYVRWGGIGGRVAGPQRLSEALCSRAKRVSEGNLGSGGKEGEGIKGEVPFARRAKEEGVKFSGGKPDGEQDFFLALVHSEN
ncbi:hypothetical protein BOTBODRAFT_592554 [Botryobasidium botryosum FD-172 SS1]|uniref:Protein phosphatase n=1 Tax=Botryobasidium botryosum (strain FD-172 SS1) TaxID=930990 RepID=A0A067LWV5_BOTB1|nr:hypothetical protein BOTBODRAFT_592554 [Botryobasidium botryosum FD-172 SS1]